MAKFTLRYTLPVDVAVTVDADDEDAALDKADILGKQYVDMRKGDSMSKCISMHGEFSEHEPSDEPFVCGRCFVFDEDAALKRITELEAEKANLLGGIASLGARLEELEVERDGAIKDRDEFLEQRNEYIGFETMSEEYTPTDEIVRAAVGYYAAKAGDVMGEAAFDRWLAAHDAQVTEKAREGYVERSDVFTDEQMRAYVESHMDEVKRQVRAGALDEAAQIADVRWQQIQALIGTESEVEADKDRIAGVTAELIAHRIRARAASIRETGQ